MDALQFYSPSGDESGPSRRPSLSTSDTLERLTNKIKFELELETLQALANPHYIYELSQTGYLDSPAFLNFLSYLSYWEKPEYARFIIYPQALHHRRLLVKKEFRLALKSRGAELVQKLSDSQYEHWRSWRSEQPSTAATQDGPAPAARV